MKRFICLTLTLLFIFCLAACDDNTKANTEVAGPGTNINTVYDSYGNILQQSIYNDQTGETITTVFTYQRINSMWVCVDQQVMVTGRPMMVKPTTVLTLRDNSLPIILIDNKDITISIIEKLEQESWWEFGYKLRIENHSDKPISVLFSDAAIATVSCYPLFTIDQIEPGHYNYFNLAWDKESLVRDWVPYLDNVEFTLRVFIGTENWTKPADYGADVLIRD